MEDTVKVLVVDDQPEIRNVLEEALTQLGHSVHTAESGKSALRHLRDEHFEVVLLDVTMPGIDGIEVLRTIRGNGSDTKVVMMTGYGTVESAVLAIKLGAHDFLQKPLILHEVDRVLRDAAHPRRRPRRPENDAPPHTPKLAEVDERHIRHVLGQELGNVSRAARVLGIHRATLYRKIVALGIRPDRDRKPENEERSSHGLDISGRSVSFPVKGGRLHVRRSRGVVRKP